MADSFSYNPTGTIAVGWNTTSRDSIFTDSIGVTDSVVTWLAPANRRYRRYYHHTGVLQIDSIGLQSTSGITFANRHYYWDAASGVLDSLGTGSSVTRLAYTPEGLDSTVTWPGSAVETINHTSTHLVYSTAFSVPALNTALSRTYGYADSLGHIGEMGRKMFPNDEVRQLRYTPAGQLAAYQVDSLTQANACTPPGGTKLHDDGQVCQSFTDYTAVRNFGFTYDSVGNLTEQRDSILNSSTTGTYGAGDRISALGTTTYTMDHDGNDSTRTAGGVTTTFGWTADNQLSTVTVDSVTLSYGYNAFGQLMQRWRTSGSGPKRLERQFLWDQGQLLAELDSSGTTRIGEYTYWPGVDQPYALVTGAQTIAATRYFSQDEMANVNGLFTASGVTQSLLYQPFGALDSTYAQLGTLADTNRLQWKGLMWEGDSARLYYVRNRWYDPAARRFISEDPLGLGGGINPYVFAGNDPINATDPGGLCSGTWVITFIDWDGSWWILTTCIDELKPVQIHGGGTTGSPTTANFENPNARGGHPMGPAGPSIPGGGGALNGLPHSELRSYARCLAAEAADRWNATNAGIDNRISAVTGFAFDQVVKDPIIDLALEGSGYATSSEFALTKRFALSYLWPSRAMFDAEIDPLVVQGISVGAVGAQGLSATAWGLGMLTEFGMGLAVSGAWNFGKALGALAVASDNCRP